MEIVVTIAFRREKKGEIKNTMEIVEKESRGLVKGGLYIGNKKERKMEMIHKGKKIVGTEYRRPR